MSKLYLRNNLKDNPRDKSFDKIVGPLSEQRKGGIKHTIQDLYYRPNEPSQSALSLLNISISVFAADKIFSRTETSDNWTRDIELFVPIHSSISHLSSSLEKCLSFLSGDRWKFFLRESEILNMGRCYYKDNFIPDAVCLFSGGSDSLTNAINLLEKGKRLLLVGHHDYSITAHKQSELASSLMQKYGSNNLRLSKVELKIIDNNERSTRSRSFLFISLAIVTASAFGPDIPIYVPENGFIGINAPLTEGRLGSYSTRTTHPKYFEYLSNIISLFGLGHELINPFKYESKGTILERCNNRDILKKLFPASISCAHPTTGRWKGFPSGNCGYCYPCLIRRASAHKMGWDSQNDYQNDPIGKPDIILERGEKSKDLISLLISINRYKSGKHKSSSLVLKSGSLGSESRNLDKLVKMHKDSMNEIIQWIEDSACKEVRKFSGI